MSRKKSQEERPVDSSGSSAAPEAPLAEPGTAPEVGAVQPAVPSRPADPDYRDLYLRALAELDNYRKLAARERRSIIESAAEAVVRKLVDPVDALERAVVDTERLEAQLPADLRAPVTRSAEGLRALRRQFHAVFESEGVVRIAQAGVRFDAAVHEAIVSIPTDEAEEGTVVEVIQPGYLLRERLVRPARVAVAARKPAPPGEGRPAGGRNGESIPNQKEA